MNIQLDNRKRKSEGEVKNALEVHPCTVSAETEWHGKELENENTWLDQHDDG